MPYIEQKNRPKKDKIVKTILELINNNVIKISGYLYYYCLENIKPSYNNYKNFIGEIIQSANEIARRNQLTLNYFYRAYIFYDKVCDLYYVEPDFKEFVEFKVAMYNGDVKINGDLNYVLYKISKDCKDIVTLIKYIKSLVITVRKIEKNILAPYEDKKEKENGPIE